MIKYVPIADVLGRELTDLERKLVPEKVSIVGPLPLPIPSPRIAVVGPRLPSSRALTLTYRIINELVSQSAIIVSGLAKGIDAQAHKSTIAAGGKTVAVVPARPVDYVPLENASLQDIIARNHLIVSPIPPHQAHVKPDYIARNRLLVVIAERVIAIEPSRSRGGTIHTIRYAKILGRPIEVHET